MCVIPNVKLILRLEALSINVKINSDHCIVLHCFFVYQLLRRVVLKAMCMRIRGRGGNIIMT